MKKTLQYQTKVSEPYTSLQTLLLLQTIIINSLQIFKQPKQSLPYAQKSSMFMTFMAGLLSMQTNLLNYQNLEKSVISIDTYCFKPGAYWLQAGVCPVSRN